MEVAKGMDALTLRAPWGYAIAELGKDIENRTWRPPARILGKRIAIHQGQSLDKSGVRSLQREYGDFDVEHGVVVCTAVVRGWIDSDGNQSESLTKREADRLRRSDWFHGPVGWVLSGIRRPRAKVKVKGALSVWKIPSRSANRI